MDYEKLYKEALERAKKQLEGANVFDYKEGQIAHDIRTTTYAIFPELEDEKIRESLLEYLHTLPNHYAHGGVCVPEWIAWLEKQCEQKPADKVEPKFKVADWCIDNEDGTIFQIVKVLDNTYTYKTNKGKEYSCTHYSLENDARFWTIQDAKDGDVLCYKDEILLYKHDIKNCTKQETTFGGFVYHCCYDGKRFIVDSLYSLTEQDKMDIHPATKGQRDLLFSKMKEAGYEWDAEKKELKEIEQKPAWSEEDEARFESCIKILQASDGYGTINTKWLKSLKERVQPQLKKLI